MNTIMFLSELNLEDNSEALHIKERASKVKTTTMQTKPRIFFSILHHETFVMIKKC